MARRARRPDRRVARHRGAGRATHLADGIALVDLGEHRLRDLARPERDLPGRRARASQRDFPPLRSLDALPGQPPAAAHVVRRPRRRAGRRSRRRCATSRLVTLTGVGGVGKTRLALQVAAEVLPRFPDGAWLCELAAADDADAHRRRSSRRRSVVRRDPAIDARRRASSSTCEPSELLLVLDNCEHLLDAAGELAESVLQRLPERADPRHEPRGPRRRGRAGLAAPLARASRRRPTHATTDRRSDAVRLFVERAAWPRRRLRARRGERGSGRRDLPPARRHPARDRARGGRASPR